METRCSTYFISTVFRFKTYLWQSPLRILFLMTKPRHRKWITKTYRYCCESPQLLINSTRAASKSAHTAEPLKSYTLTDRYTPVTSRILVFRQTHNMHFGRPRFEKFTSKVFYNCTFSRLSHCEDIRYNSLIGFSYCLTGAWCYMCSLATVLAGSEEKGTGRLNGGGRRTAER